VHPAILDSLVNNVSQSLFARVRTVLQQCIQIVLRTENNANLVMKVSSTTSVPQNRSARAQMVSPQFTQTARRTESNANLVMKDLWETNALQNQCAFVPMAPQLNIRIAMWMVKKSALLVMTGGWAKTVMRFVQTRLSPIVSAMKLQKAGKQEICIAIRRRLGATIGRMARMPVIAVP